MMKALRLLIVEDSDSDAMLLLRVLKNAGFQVDSLRVDTGPAMRAALLDQEWDLVTSDHSMPSFDAPAAQALLKEVKPGIPMIIVSGEVTLNLQEILLKLGVRACVHKNELSILPGVIAKVMADLQES